MHHSPGKWSRMYYATIISITIHHPTFRYITCDVVSSLLLCLCQIFAYNIRYLLALNSKSNFSWFNHRASQERHYQLNCIAWFWFFLAHTYSNVLMYILYILLLCLEYAWSQKGKSSCIDHLAENSWNWLWIWIVLC